MNQKKQPTIKLFILTLIMILLFSFGFIKSKENYYNCLSSYYHEYKNTSIGHVILSSDILINIVDNKGVIKLVGNIIINDELYNVDRSLRYRLIPINDKGLFEISNIEQKKKKNDDAPDNVVDIIIGIEGEDSIYGYRYINSNSMLIGDGTFPILICAPYIQPINKSTLSKLDF